MVGKNYPRKQWLGHVSFQVFPKSHKILLLKYPNEATFAYLGPNPVLKFIITNSLKVIFFLLSPQPILEESKMTHKKTHLALKPH